MKTLLSYIVNNKLALLLTAIGLISLVLWQTCENEFFSKLNAYILFSVLFIRTFIKEK